MFRPQKSVPMLTLALLLAPDLVGATDLAKPPPVPASGPAGYQD